MAKVLIVYDSRSGNTQKMALEIAEGAKTVKHVDVIVKKVGQTTLDDLVGADGIIIGSPTYYGLMSGKLKALIDESVKIHGKLDGKVGAAFRVPAESRLGPRPLCYRSYRRCWFTV